MHRSFVDRPDYYEGANGYALRQASFHRSLQERYTAVWKVVRGVMDEHYGRCYGTSLRFWKPSDSLASPTLADTASGDQYVADSGKGFDLVTL